MIFICAGTRSSDHRFFDKQESILMIPPVITIDPRGARDLDDALAVSPLAEGGWQIDVCLPDVPLAVSRGTDCDLSAREAGVTHYGRDEIRRSMLGSELTDAITLSASDERNMIHIKIHITSDLEARIHSIERIYGRVLASLSYEEADVAIADEAHPYHGHIARLWDIACRLHEERAAATGAVFDLKHQRYTNEEGQVLRLEGRTAHRSNMLVMELMILTNVALARYAREKQAAILYRNHCLEGFQFGDRTSAAAEIAKIKGVGKHVALRMVSSMGNQVRQAEMGVEPRGHYGLDVDVYAWFTSPLRRYADIVNLRALLDDEKDPDLHQLAGWLTAIHRQQKDASSKHHAENHRREVLRYIDRGDIQALAAYDLHTILRALEENEGYDRGKAQNYIFQRLGNLELSGRDIDVTLETGARLFGEGFKAKIDDWLKEDPARELLLKGHRGEKLDIPKADRNYKGELLERGAAAQAKVKFEPARRTGLSHAPIFTSEVEWILNGETEKAEGNGRTIKEAEFVAARLLLEKLGPLPKGQVNAAQANPKSALLEYAAKNGDSASFLEKGRYGPPHDTTFSVEVVYHQQGTAYTANGAGKSLKEAERNASQKLLQDLLGASDNEQRPS